MKILEGKSKSWKWIEIIGKYEAGIGTVTTATRGAVRKSLETLKHLLIRRTASLNYADSGVLKGRFQSVGKAD